MARFRGAVGYAAPQIEGAAGVYDDNIVEFDYYGDITRNTRRLEPGESVNDDISTSNLISIVADPYASEHFFAIRYVRWAGVLWKVSNVEVQSPRLLLSLGEVYNGPIGTPSTP